MDFRCALFLVVAVLLFGPPPVAAQNIRALPDRQQWYLTAGESTYVIGVNEAGMLQSLYWGPGLPVSAVLPKAHSEPERASFDPPIATTPLEYPAWAQACLPSPL